MQRYKNKPRRIYCKDEYCFVTVKTQFNKPIFKNNDYAEIFEQSLMFLKNRGDFELSTGVLLPDHFHLLLMPIKKNISEIMHDLKSYTAQEINKIRRRGIIASSTINESGEAGSLTCKCWIDLPPVWQRSFYYHIIGNDWDFENHYNYIIWNPEKHNYIDQGGHWPWLWQN
jgi:putative transposase